MKKTAVTLFMVCIISSFITGCATSSKVMVNQVGDNKLTCDQIMAELEKMDQSEKEIESKKGATGTNVAAALLWLPGLAYTYYDAGQATEAINTRRANLIKLHNDKNCD
jgi:hypothetical protein